MSRISIQPPHYNVGAQAITPSDSTDLLSPAVGLFIGGAGNVAGILESGDTVTFNGCLVGTTLPFIFRRILATGTTATNLVGGK